ncbi:MAG TPA: histidinol-phosphate transaminase [Acidimicrobiales bacterium]|nr:histidinol-phosphate transaminase [Acidimicrobiales bacterium]
MPLRPRPEVDALPAYVPGRSAQAAIDEHRLQSAIKLASNESSFGPLPSAAKAIEDVLGTLNRYPDNGAVALRVELADYVGRDTDRIAVGCGSVGLIQQLCLAYAGPGDEIVFGDPSFEAYPVFTQLSGATAVRVPLRRQTIDAAAIAAAITPATRLVLVATPNNPTGTALRTGELVQIVDAAPDSCLVVVDAAYQEFVSGYDVPDPIQLFSDRPNVAVLRTFSKAYGLAALRIGWMCAPREVVATVNKVHLPFAENSLGQAAALTSIRSHHEMLERVAWVTAERRRVTKAVREAGYMIPSPQGNFVWLPAGSRARELAVALEKSGIVTRPFEGLGVRVTIGSPEENDAFLEAFASVAESEDVAAHWQSPTGAAAAEVNQWLRRLNSAEARLVEHGATLHDGLTEPDPGGDEKWESAQVWGHLGEFGAYWLVELDRVLDGEPDQPFGRTKADEARRTAIAAGSSRSVEEHLDSARRAIDRLRSRLTELTTDDWAKAGTHSTLGRMTIADQLQHFLVGHYEEHLDQLDGLAS